MSIQGFARRQVQRQQATAPSPCLPCHQPSNAAVSDSVHTSPEAESWFTDLDVGLPVGEQLDTFNANLDLGQQGEDERYGASAEASLAKGSFLGLDGAAGKLSAEASVGPDGARIGASATFLEASTPAWSVDGQDDDWIAGRVGLGEGVGMAGRIHTSDKDGDGRRECGTGIDIGPLSADVVTERLCPLNAIASLLGGDA